MQLGFFDDEATEIKATKIKEVKTRTIKGTCKSCGLSSLANSPKLGIQGKGLKEVLIVIEKVSKQDDKNGKYLTDRNGKNIKELLSEHFNVFSDCWIIAATQCYSSKKIKANQCLACSIKVQEAIKELKPKVIITFGKAAIDAVVNHKITGRVKNLKLIDWVGYQIPDQDYKTFICPTYDDYQYFVPRNATYQTDIVIKNQMIEHIYKANQCVTKPFYISNYGSEIMPITNKKEAIDIIRRIARNKENEAVSIDYETTGIKPHRNGHKIVSTSISDGLFSYAFPFFNDEEFRTVWKEFLLSKVKKIIHNAKYENTWSKNRSGFNNEKGTWIKNIIADTMIDAHIVHNKKKVGLKFLVYVYFGIIGYDAEIDPYLEPSQEEKDKYGANAINRIEQFIEKYGIEKLLIYNGYDTFFDYKLWEIQQTLLLKNLTKKGSEFFLEGSLALGKAENKGILLDTENAKLEYKKLTKRMEKAEAIIQESEEMKLWNKDKVFRPSAPGDLTHLLFKCMNIKGDENNLTATGKYKADVEALEQYNNPIVKNTLQWRKLKKVRDTYLNGFLIEETDNIIHTSLNLHTVDTYRSCIAKGSLILAAQDFIKYPNGIPIEKIKIGDYIYCFNDKLQLIIKKVLWAGKTGNKKVIRIHYNGAIGRKSYLDVTPEHKIRVINGKYIRADKLLDYDFRDKKNPKWKWQPKVRVLSCRRQDDRLFSTGNFEELEHRKIYEYFSNEKLDDNDVIHHIDENHLNHTFSNLEKTDHTMHAQIHYPNTIGTEQARKNNRKIVKENHANGKYDHIYKSGQDNYNSIKLTKEDCLSALRKAGGRLTKVPYDFIAFKRNCEYNGIDIKKELLFYAEDGKYLTAKIIFNTLNEYGFSEACKKLTIGYYRLKKLCKYYGISYERSWGNQCGKIIDHKITINNHVITKIEYLKNTVDVYDIEVEDEHNFIANEICVHNSSNDPNLQNVPARDVEVMNLLRKLIKARRNRKLAEYDYKAMEAVIIAIYNKDPNWIRYVSDPANDMHRDMAAKLVLRKKTDVMKDERQIAKNGFVFPTVYTSYYKNTAKNMWDQFSPETFKHLRSKGIKTLNDYTDHVKSVERWFWEDQFPVGYEWMNKTVKDYEKKGYVDLLTGFRCYGPMTKAQVINTPIQGTASHCKLWTFKELSKLIERKKMSSRLLLEIHDSIIPDVDPAEEAYLDYQVWLYGTQKIRENWNWLIVPLFIEKKISKINGSWAEMENQGLLKGDY